MSSKEGELCFYTVERMLVSKLITYANRREFKDFYDIAFLMKKTDPHVFSEPAKVAGLVETVIDLTDTDELAASYTRAFRNIDLRFKHLREKDVGPFVNRSLRELRRYKNELGKA